MRFTCEKSMLVAGLNIAGRTVAQKSSLSVLEGILCRAGNNICLTGYTMETAISYRSKPRSRMQVSSFCPPDSLAISSAVCLKAL